MSNPGVIKLQKKTINKSKVWLDDNLGESIHIHIDDYRADLSIEGFEQLCTDIGHAVNALLDVEGFDCNKIDKVYFEVSLWKRLMKLKSVEIDKVKLGEMWAPAKKGIYPLATSRAVRALNGDTKENDGPRYSHHIGQTSKDRLDTMYSSIKENGYPLNDQYIVVYGDDNIIRDGQHRAACLYDQYGDIEVPVMRMRFDDYKPENIALANVGDFRKRRNFRRDVKEKGFRKAFISRLKNIYSRFKGALAKRKNRRFIKKHKQETDILNGIFKNK